MIDEGYVKYVSHWTPGPATHKSAAMQLDAWRKPLFDAGLIGQYKDLGIGYGNISMRRGSSDLFLISGTQTGHLPATDERHYSLVTDCDIRSNVVRCSGPIQASSEAMTHASIYALGDAIGYGTPSMARELDRLYRTGGFRESGVAVLAGHDEGIISFGTTLEEAANRVLVLVPR